MSQESNASPKRILIMSCSGGANVGQMSHQVATELVREGFGKSFCLAGIGAHLRGSIRSAVEADNILIDGCTVGCGKMILQHAEIPLKKYVVLTDLGIEKTMNPDLSREDIEMAKNIIKELCEKDEPTFPVIENGSGCSCCS